MLFFNVVFYQYALVNANFVGFRTYWQGNSLKIIKKYDKWSRGQFLNDPQEWTCYEEILEKSDILICVPGWLKYRDDCNPRNVTLARLVSQHPHLNRIIPFVCRYQFDPTAVDRESSYCYVSNCYIEDEFCLTPEEEAFRAEPIRLHRDTDRFSHLFHGNDWVKIQYLKEDTISEIIHYFLVAEMQRLLIQHRCYGGSIDGVFSFRTKEGLRKFQMLKLLTGNGIPNRETWTLLRNTPS